MNKFPFQPMLACTVKDVAKLQFPLIATPKLDGIRCTTLKVDAMLGKCHPVCRSLKPVPNEHVRDHLETYCPPGLDGELMVRDTATGKLMQFHDIQGRIMRHEGRPNFEFHVFDYLDRFQDSRYAKGVFTKYMDRLHGLKKLILPEFCKAVQHVLIRSNDELESYEESILEQGYEGVMLRTPHSPYKFGRSTFSEHWLMKLKRFHDGEAVIVDSEERMSNQSPKKDDPLGRMRRHTFQDDMVPTNSLGSLLVKDVKTGVQFNVGSGFTEQDRVKLWDDRHTLVGKVIKYKSQLHGAKDKPRLPIFLGFRHLNDIS